MSGALDEALEVARQERPERLQPGFADGVMRRIAEVAGEYRVPLLIATKAGFLTSAALAVVAAVVTAHSGSEPLESESPPPSMVFSLPEMAAPHAK
ncbi:hypothetical protein ACFQY0_14185 [Haloferula chungangensis]|uniref:Uncharacterized protein n=1 Tax=Haloferula chungangensis TaxID=1048331 RepID=A0ABW2LAF1_9BACT